MYFTVLPSLEWDWPRFCHCRKLCRWAALIYADELLFVEIKQVTPFPNWVAAGCEKGPQKNKPLLFITICLLKVSWPFDAVFVNLWKLLLQVGVRSVGSRAESSSLVLNGFDGKCTKPRKQQAAGLIPRRFEIELNRLRERESQYPHSGPEEEIPLGSKRIRGNYRKEKASLGKKLQIVLLMSSVNW
jgi:hypothetical protein